MNIILEFIIINSVYILAWFIVYKFRSSKNDDIRIFDNDYEFYESLSKDDRELYWQADTKLINTFLLQLLIVLNIVILLHWLTNNVYVYLILFIVFIVLMIIYAKAYLNLKRKFKQ